MTKESNRKYKMEIDPKILQLLGPNLYTNIYYVLAELVANAYDADASNVYIISKDDRVVVEDDGKGMSYKDGDVDKYLNVAAETRSTIDDSITSEKKRRKIGRKGIGKLSALSVSDHVVVKTVKKGEKSGFVLSKDVKSDKMLDPLNDTDITFEIINEHGTSIVMMHPHYQLNKSSHSIKRNLLKIFPLINSDFKVHIIIDDQPEITIDSFDEEMIAQLGGVIILGEKFWGLSNYFINDFAKTNVQLIETRSACVKTLEMKNKFGKVNNYELSISGWVGVYKSTRGRIGGYDDFPDNFISLFSNSKLGEYNILPHISKNRLPEVYVVGQLHVDLFEETELPDMALSNRQGYKTDDIRYQSVLEYSKELLSDILEIRMRYSNQANGERKREKLRLQKIQEDELIRVVDDFRKSASSGASKKIAQMLNSDEAKNVDQVSKIIENQMNEFSPIIGIKNKVDSQKKKILISHASVDKDLADIVYNMLVFNNVQPEDILYTSCDNESSRIPDPYSLFEYLKKFFVESYSTTKIFAIYVTSHAMSQNWYAVTEVGAGWITEVDHKIFNLNNQQKSPPENYIPLAPLDVGPVWHTSVRDEHGLITMPDLECDKFAVKIENICDKLGYKKKTRAQNRSKLAEYITIS